MMPSITAMPKQRNKRPIAADTLKAVPVTSSPSTPPEDRHRDHAHREQRIDHRAEIEEQQHPRSGARLIGTTIDNRLMASLQIAEFADPFERASLSESWTCSTTFC